MQGKTPAAAQAQETARQDASLKKRIKLRVSELRQAGAGHFLGLSEEGQDVPLHQAVQLGVCSGRGRWRWTAVSSGPGGAADQWLARVIHDDTALLHGLMRCRAVRSTIAAHTV